MVILGKTLYWSATNRCEFHERLLDQSTYYMVKHFSWHRYWPFQDKNTASIIITNDCYVNMLDKEIRFQQEVATITLHDNQ